MYRVLVLYNEKKTNFINHNYDLDLGRTISKNSLWKRTIDRNTEKLIHCLTVCLSVCCTRFSPIRLNGLEWNLVDIWEL